MHVMMSIVLNRVYEHGEQLQCQVAEKNPGCKGTSYYGIQAIASSAAFLFHILFECCYVCAYDGRKKYLEPQEKQHLVGQDC